MAIGTLLVAFPPTISKLFLPDAATTNEATLLSFTINNPNSDSLSPNTDMTLTGISFTDTLPAGLVVASPSNLSSDCGGTVTAVPGSDLISLTEGVIGAAVPLGPQAVANGACFISLYVTACTAGTLNNTTGPITANESGTGVPSNSASLSITSGGPAATTIALNSSVNPSVYGQPVLVTALVGAIAPACGGTPAGTVSFLDGATTIGTGTLNSSGQATFSTSLFAVGSHALTAVFGGDANFGGTTSPVSSQTVNRAAATTVVTSTLNPSSPGQSVTFTATVGPVAPGAGLPTGIVTFRDGAAGLGTATLDSSGVAAFDTAVLAPGSHAISGVYSGDTNFSGSASAAVSQTVSRVATTTALDSSLNPLLPGRTVTFTATVGVTAPGFGMPTGMVTFMDGAVTLGTAVLDSSGIATFSTTGLSGGIHSITAAYSGDANYSASTSAAVSQVVSIVVPTMSEWGMLIFMILAGVGSLFWLRRSTRPH